jgi:hypothetical protein
MQYLRLDEFGFSDRVSKYWRRDDVPLEERFTYNFNAEVTSEKQLAEDIETGELCSWKNGAIGCLRIVHNHNSVKLDEPRNRM